MKFCVKYWKGYWYRCGCFDWKICKFCGNYTVNTHGEIAKDSCVNFQLCLSNCPSACTEHRTFNFTPQVLLQLPWIRNIAVIEWNGNPANFYSSLKGFLLKVLLVVMKAKSSHQQTNSASTCLQIWPIPMWITLATVEYLIPIHYTFWIIFECYD